MARKRNRSSGRRKRSRPGRVRSNRMGDAELVHESKLVSLSTRQSCVSTILLCKTCKLFQLKTWPITMGCDDLQCDGCESNTLEIPREYED